MAKITKMGNKKPAGKKPAPKTSGKKPVRNNNTGGAPLSGVEEIAAKLENLMQEFTEVIDRNEDAGADQEKIDALTEALDALSDAADILYDVQHE